MNAAFIFVVIALSVASVSTQTPHGTIGSPNQLIPRGWIIPVWRCQPDWIPSATSCYLLPNITLTWLEAQDYCTEISSIPGYLTEVSSPVEYEFIRDLLVSNRTDSAWLGGTDLNTPAIWQWVTSSVHIRWFPFWARGKPNGAGHCLAMDNAIGYLWTDDSCLKQRPFVCESRKAQ